MKTDKESSKPKTISKTKEKVMTKVEKTESPEKKVRREKDPEKKAKKTDETDSPEKKVGREKDPEKKAKKTDETEIPEKKARREKDPEKKAKKTEETDGDEKKVRKEKDPEKKAKKTEETDGAEKKVRREKDPEKKAKKTDETESPEKKVRKDKDPGKIAKKTEETEGPEKKVGREKDPKEKAKKSEETEETEGPEKKVRKDKDPEKIAKKTDETESPEKKVSREKDPEKKAKKTDDDSEKKKKSKDREVPMSARDSGEEAAKTAKLFELEAELDLTRRENEDLVGQFRAAQSQWFEQQSVVDRTEREMHSAETKASLAILEANTAQEKCVLLEKSLEESDFSFRKELEGLNASKSRVLEESQELLGRIQELENADVRNQLERSLTESAELRKEVERLKHVEELLLKETEEYRQGKIDATAEAHGLTGVGRKLEAHVKVLEVGLQRLEDSCRDHEVERNNTARQYKALLAQTEAEKIEWQELMSDAEDKLSLCELGRNEDFVEYKDVRVESAVG